MPNPIYAALGGAKGPQGGPANFIRFMKQMQGQDPNEIMQKLLSDGKINQNQLNQAQQMAKQLEGQLSGFKAMFGFK